jgi:endonuclease-3
MGRRHCKWNLKGFRYTVCAVTKRRKHLSPAEIVHRLSALYGEPVWRPHGDPMTELVLTILSQNTSDTNSGRAFVRLKGRFPSWEAVIEAPVGELEEAIARGGLARQKAPRIKLALRVYEARGAGTWSSSAICRWPRPRPARRSAASARRRRHVLMFSLGRPALPVDTHVHRVAQRLGLVPAKASAEKAHDILEAMLAPEEVYPFHISLIKHGRLLCRAQRPLCGECPLLDGCPFGQTSVGGKM